MRSLITWVILALFYRETPKYKLQNPKLNNCVSVSSLNEFFVITKALYMDFKFVWLDAMCNHRIGTQTCPKGDGIC